MFRKFMVITVFATSLPVGAAEVFTGDVKLACEAVLCLPAGNPPHECAASLARYFGIVFKRAFDTARGRASFLSLCPRNVTAGPRPQGGARASSSGDSTMNEAAQEGVVQATRQQILFAIEELRPMLEEKSRTSSQSQLLLDACVAAKGPLEEGNCAGELTDFNEKRLPVIHLMEQMERLEDAFATARD